MRNSMSLVITLAVVCIISGASLAYFHQMTEAILVQRQLEQMRDAVIAVVPGGISFTESTSDALPAGTGGQALLEGMRVFPVFDEGKALMGYAVLHSTKGFEGPIRLMVGIDPNSRVITGLTVLEQSETPGLGARIADAGFRNQFIGKSLDDPFVSGNDIDGITGATVSTDAVIKIVREAIASVDTEAN